MNGIGPHPRRYSVQPPYVEPPTCGTPSNDTPQNLAILSNELEQSQRMNESLHSKLGQLSVHLSNVQTTSSQNARQNISLKEENDALRGMLQKSMESKGVHVRPLDMSREVHHRLRNLEEFCHKLSEREIDRSDRLSASSGGISLSNISLVSSAVVAPGEPSPLYKDAGSTSEYSSLSSLDRLDGMSLRERLLEMETNAMKQDAKIKILERHLQEKHLLIKRLKAEVEQFRHSPQLPQYPREFNTQI